MKQLDLETSNYKHKEEIKTFVDAFNDLTDKYVKSFDNCDADLNKVKGNIDKKNASIGKLEASLVDLNKKIDELTSLKELSNEEIKRLNAQKGEISYTDSEVQKMELDDINAQISSKKGKISKIDAKMDSTKAKIKSESETKKAQEKELKDLENTKRIEEEALYKTESILSYIKETQESLNKAVLDIINTPYTPVVEKAEDSTETTEGTETSGDAITLEPVKEDNTPVEDKREVLEEVLAAEKREIVLPEIPEDAKMEEDEGSIIDEPEVDSLLGINSIINEEELSKEIEVEENTEIPVSEPVVIEEDEKKEEVIEPSTDGVSDDLLEEAFSKESLNFDSFSQFAKDKMIQNRDQVIKNIEILKKHNVPLEYTVDQSEIFYNISSQDLDDLLSIITTDDEGNGMGFSIDFTYNVLSELSKINVDKLIDVYNSEFMNVSAKSGIINLLKLTNPNLTDFEKNRRTNIEILKSLGAKTVDDIVSKYPDFINMDNPLFVNVLNVFDKSDLVEKLNTDIGVIPKILEYWKNN